ncbi:hypothetical protein, partial [Rothia terrae]|uniref:hypothetical protein n=1 Tax=Rothia terrae TaxID=396015 RepID=UPI00288230A9
NIFNAYIHEDSLPSSYPPHIHRKINIPHEKPLLEEIPDWLTRVRKPSQHPYFQQLPQLMPLPLTEVSVAIPLLQVFLLSTMFMQITSIGAYL